MIVLFGRMLGVVAGTIAILQIATDAKRRRIGLVLAIIWLCIWGIVVALALFPTMLDELFKATGGKTGLGTVLGTAVVLVLFLLYKQNQRVEILNSKINKLAQRLSR